MQVETEIDNEDADLLNRDEFASRLAKSIEDYKPEDSLTIGIMGSWGSGKSSLINLTENHLKKENVIIIRFNPWYFSNQDNLYLQFFKLIISTLRSKEKNENIFKSRIKPKRELFKKQDNSLENYFNYLKDNSMELNINNLKHASSLESYDSLQYHKKQCEDYIGTFNRKIVVIIDDIDRMTNAEIAQIFTLVKSLADFDHFIYILSFDKLIVTKALEKVNSEYKDDFIDKIINIPIIVPKISDSKMNELIFDKISPIYNFHLGKNFKNYNNDFNNIIEHLKTFIKDIRDLKRYSNLLEFYINSVIDDLNIDDFFLILGLQLFNYELYLKVKNNENLLIDDNLFKDNEHASVTPRGFGEEFKSIIKNDDWNKYQNLLIFLFPLLKVNPNPMSHDEYEKWNKEHKICSEKYFEKYFTLSLENYEANETLIDRLITMTDDREISEVFKKRNNLEYNDSLLRKFSKKINEIPNENCEHYLIALMKCGDEIKLPYFSRKCIKSILIKLFEKIDSKNRMKILKMGIEYPNNILTMSELVYEIMYNYKLIEENMGSMTRLMIDKIHKCSENKDFLNREFLQDLLFYWSQIESEDAVKQYILENVKTNDEKLSFLSKFRTKSDTQFYIIGAGSNAHLVLDLDELNKYHGLEEYEKVVTSKLNEINITEDIRELCEIFLKQYEEYKIIHDLIG